MMEHTLSLVCTVASSEEIVDAWAEPARIGSVP